MKQDTLLPDRHPNPDFFIADIFDSLPVKDDRHTMEHPFFTLSTRKDTRTIRYERNGISIKLSPSAEFGLPTMMDKDILLYAGSLIVAEINKGRIPPRTLRFSCRDLMITTNRHTNDVAYQQLKNAFERLAGCLVTTNIKTNELEKTEGFHLIESYKILKKSRDERRMVQIELTLSDWYYNSLIGKEVLTINRDYFRLRKTLERRLYEIARKHCGRQQECSIGLASLHKKCGSRSDLNKFRFQIRQIIQNDLASNHFPDYRMTLLDNDIILFEQKYSGSEKGQQQSAFDFEDMPAIQHSTLEKAKRIVQDAGTGWDFYALQEQFTISLMNGFNPEKPDGAFINFIKKKVQKAP